MPSESFRSVWKNWTSFLSQSVLQGGAGWGLRFLLGCLASQNGEGAALRPNYEVIYLKVETITLDSSSNDGNVFCIGDYFVGLDFLPFWYFFWKI